jgi:hypothetical protein
MSFEDLQGHLDDLSLDLTSGEIHGVRRGAELQVIQGYNQRYEQLA